MSFKTVEGIIQHSVNKARIMILFINTCLNIEKKIDILHNMTRDKLNVFCTFVFHQFTKKKKKPIIKVCLTNKEF